MSYIKIFLLSLFFVPSNCYAQQITSDINNYDRNISGYLGFIETLTVNGYSITLIEKTLLNRVLIKSKKENITRETIISISTDLILRDSFWTD